MKTTNKLHPVWAFLNNAINCEYYQDVTGKDFAASTNTEKWQFVANDFKNWLCPYELQRAKGNYQNAFAYWLQCCPGSIDLPIYYSDILELAKSWGSIPENATEKQEQKIIDNYYNFMSAKILQAMNKAGVKVY